MEVPSSIQAQITPQEQFFRYFQQQITALQDQMGRLNDKALIGGERKDATEHCLAGITRLSTEVKDASGTLPPYDVRTYSEAVKALQEKLAETQATFAPKQKFSFKTKKNASAISIQDAVELAAQRGRGFDSENQSTTSSFSTTPIHLITPPNEQSVSQRSGLLSQNHNQISSNSLPTTKDNDKTQSAQGLHRTPTSTTITSLTSSYITLPPSATHAQAPCHLAKLKNSIINLSIPTSETAPFASLTINDISSSLLLCGSVDGPAHITGIRNSTMLVSCRQFRMHECTNVTIYLHCSSRPIVEDCKDIKFTKLPGFYYDLVYPASKGSPMPAENLWDQVDDFKWLRAEHSPNWSVLSTEEQIPDATWLSIVPGKSGRSVSEILAAVNIPIT